MQGVLPGVARLLVHARAAMEAADAVIGVGMAAGAGKHRPVRHHAFLMRAQPAITLATGCRLVFASGVAVQQWPRRFGRVPGGDAAPGFG